MALEFFFFSVAPNYKRNPASGWRPNAFLVCTRKWWLQEVLVFLMFHILVFQQLTSSKCVGKRLTLKSVVLRKCSQSLIFHFFWVFFFQVVKECLLSNFTKSHQKADKVDVVVYYETLCPDCRQYLSLMAFPTLVMLDDIMTLTVVPYGNAKVGSGVCCCCFVP